LGNELHRGRYKHRNTVAMDASAKGNLLSSTKVSYRDTTTVFAGFIRLNLVDPILASENNWKKAVGTSLWLLQCWWVKCRFSAYLQTSKNCFVYWFERSWRIRAVHKCSYLLIYLLVTWSQANRRLTICILLQTICGKYDFSEKVSFKLCMSVQQHHGWHLAVLVAVTCKI